MESKINSQLNKAHQKSDRTIPLTDPNWAESTELVSLAIYVIPETNITLYPQYTIALHAWFLDQVRQWNPQLSEYLHDGQSEKPFTISGLEGDFYNHTRQLQLIAGNTYSWCINLLSKEVIQWATEWLLRHPPSLNLRAGNLNIKEIKFALPPCTYKQLKSAKPNKTINLSFVSPTSFRRKGHHFPLPVPTNLFSSYLRRWNDFSGQEVNSEKFLEWIDEQVIIYRHNLETVKVAAGKKGTVTGFTGAIELSLSSEAYKSDLEYVQLYSALAHFAAYCGTGHKTTFGLGQTKLGWLASPPNVEMLAQNHQLATRIEELTANFMATQKRRGGERALKVCETRATILARREIGESLQEIARDLDLPYETVKTYAKLARRLLNLS